MKKIFLLFLLISQGLHAQTLLSELPTIDLTEIQKLYAGNLVRNTESFHLKGKVKSATANLILLDFSKTEKYTDYINYAEMYKLEFSVHQLLTKDEKGLGNNNLADLITSTEYFFNESNHFLLQKIRQSKPSNRLLCTEYTFDSLGFMTKAINFSLDLEAREINYVKDYEWDHRSKTINFHFSYPGMDVEEGYLSYEDESYIKQMYHDTTISFRYLDIDSTTIYDSTGNIIEKGIYDLTERSYRPNSYSVSYKYDSDNQLIEIQKQGDGYIHLDERITFEYDHLDEFGNWQLLTLIKTDENGWYSKVMYKREIEYYQ